ncbi:MAG: EAL domain-containing protein [Rhizobiaceae bacterium]|nr:EAL domain-containing protein [Rhizobiaceae bacterium]
MTSGSPGPLGDAWAVDEVGLAFGLLGDYRLRTTYQPVFERRLDRLVPVAVSAASVLHRGGRDLGALRDTALLEFPMRRLAGRLESELALRNLAFLDEDEPAGLDLLVPVDTTARLDVGAIDDLLMLADELGVDRALVSFDVSRVAACLGNPIRLDPRTCVRLAADVSAAGAWPPGAAGCKPWLVRLPASSARLMLEDGATQRLMTALAGAVERQGGVLQVEGIATPLLLRRALAAGCTRLQGDFLAPALAAGEPIDRAPRPIAGFADGDLRAIKA